MHEGVWIPCCIERMHCGVLVAGSQSIFQCENTFKYYLFPCIGWLLLNVGRQVCVSGRASSAILFIVAGQRNIFVHVEAPLYQHRRAIPCDDAKVNSCILHQESHFFHCPKPGARSVRQISIFFCVAFRMVLVGSICYLDVINCTGSKPISSVDTFPVLISSHHSVFPLQTPYP